MLHTRTFQLKYETRVRVDVGAARLCPLCEDCADFRRKSSARTTWPARALLLYTVTHASVRFKRPAITADPYTDDDAAAKVARAMQQRNRERFLYAHMFALLLFCSLSHSQRIAFQCHVHARDANIFALVVYCCVVPPTKRPAQQGTQQSARDTTIWRANQLVLSHFTSNTCYYISWQCGYHFHECGHQNETFSRARKCARQCFNFHTLWRAR